MKLTDKPLSFGYSVVDSHSSFCPSKQKPAEAVFYVNQVKLTDKPLSFGYSVVDSHSSSAPPKAKTRRSGFLRKPGETDR
ncbi:hypothetical protein PCS95_03055 [Escherichia coli]|uniref:hypothetical protein n=1 Tax=Escherichia coli TaxID=562 RepID=UPI0027E47BA2|nr:hypothetical protein [Escherichia coli]WMO28244.1 hypothetical protein PCS95_03055 [Escherichia coli]